MLVVEDERTIAQAVGGRLRAEDFDVTQEYDGPGAVATAASWEPHLIVLDVMLPGYDGHEVWTGASRAAGARADADGT